MKHLHNCESLIKFEKKICELQFHKHPWVTSAQTALFKKCMFKAEVTGAPCDKIPEKFIIKLVKEWDWSMNEYTRNLPMK